MSSAYTATAGYEDDSTSASRRVYLPNVQSTGTLQDEIDREIRASSTALNDLTSQRTAPRHSLDDSDYDEEAGGAKAQIVENGFVSDEEIGGVAKPQQPMQSIMFPSSSTAAGASTTGSRTPRRRARSVASGSNYAESTTQQRNSNRMSADAALLMRNASAQQQLGGGGTRRDSNYGQIDGDDTSFRLAGSRPGSRSSQQPGINNASKTHGRKRSSASAALRASKRASKSSQYSQASRRDHDNDGDRPSSAYGDGHFGYLFIDAAIDEDDTTGTEDEGRLVDGNVNRNRVSVTEAKRMRSYQGLLDQSAQAVTDEEDGEEGQDRPDSFSSEEAWYFLRALVGEELKAESGMLWKLRDLDGNGRYEDDSDDEDFDSRDAPIMRYLIRHFLLTLPLVRDTAPNDPDRTTDVPVFWTEGLYPILRALYDADLSKGEDERHGTVASKITGVYLRKGLERFVSAGLKLSSTSQTAGEDLTQTASSAGQPTGAYNFQPQVATPQYAPSPRISEPSSEPNSGTSSPRQNNRFSFGSFWRGSGASTPKGKSTPTPAAVKEQTGLAAKPEARSGPPPALGAIAINPGSATNEQIEPNTNDDDEASQIDSEATSIAPADHSDLNHDIGSSPHNPALSRSNSRATGLTSGMESASFVSARDTMSTPHPGDSTDDDEDRFNSALALPLNIDSKQHHAEPDQNQVEVIRDGSLPTSEPQTPKQSDVRGFQVDDDADQDDTIRFRSPAKSAAQNTVVTANSGSIFAPAAGASSAEGMPTSRQIPQQDFVAHMAIPAGFDGTRSRPVSSAPLLNNDAMIAKGGTPWPFGATVPFWRGVPFDRLKWGGFECDVVGVRSSLFPFSPAFIIRVRRPARLDEYVVRTEAQFVKFQKNLDRTYPAAHIRRVPNADSKDDQIVRPRSYSNGSATSVNVVRPAAHRMNSSTSNETRQSRTPSSTKLAAGLKNAANDPYGPNSNVGDPKRNSNSSVFAKKLRVQSLNGDLPPRTNRGSSIIGAGPARPYSVNSNRSASSLGSRLSLNLDFKKMPPHDGRRRALRAWLRDTLSIRTVGHHKETAAFLLLGSFVPKQSDVNDILKREAIDEARRNARVGVAQGAAQRARATRSMWASVEYECIHGDGIVEISNAIKTTKKIEQLPVKYYKTVETMRYSFAQFLYETFVASESSGTTFAKLRALHQAFPYWLVRQAFKIGRAKTMAKYLQDILLARPFGSKSLLQKILAISLDDDPKKLLQDINRLRARIASATMCEKIDAFVHDSREKKDVIRRYARENDVELVLCIIRGADEPRLAKYELERVVRASKKYSAFIKSPKSALAKRNATDPDVRLVLDLQEYLKVISRDRDSNMLRSLLGEDEIAHALEIVAGPFVELLKRVYKVGNGGQALTNLQKFVEQFIIIVDALRSRIQEPQKSVRIISRLLTRHQQNLYDFVHNVHKRETIFEEFLQWFWTASVFLRRGLAEPVDLDAVMPTDLDERAFLYEEVEELVDFQRKKRTRQYQNMCRRYAGDVDGDDPVIVEGDGHGRSRVEPLNENKPKEPMLLEIPACVEAFRDQLKRVFAV
ncbi:hypothetical protein OIO90_002307 [Microbotryomycetes sp. JL221]|nr:hypothetical protein OIO90_002307 [Microbotryomycetes sp. JL221]